VAIIRGKTVQEREGMRPVLDKAFIVEGLDELPMDERRRKMERAGICWFCGACGDCKSCGTGAGKISEEEPVKEMVDRKGKGRMVESEMGQRRTKRVKFEHAGDSMPTLTSAFPASSSMAPDLTKYPSHPFEQQPPAPALQYDYELRGSVSGQFNEPAPAFNFQSQWMPFRNPRPQDPSDNREGAQGFPSGEQDGNIPIDPALEQPQAGALSYGLSDYALSGDDGLPPFPGFGTGPVSLPDFADFGRFNGNQIDLESYKMDDEALARLLAGNSDTSSFDLQGLLKEETKSPDLKIPVAEQSTAPKKCSHPASEASQAGHSVIVPKNPYPEPV
jgi:hypothetical protein